MAKEFKSNAELIKFALDNNPPTWAGRINVDSRTDFDKIGVLLAAQNYKTEMNQIFEELVNRIGLTKLHSQSFTNKLGFFKTGAMRLGSTYQEITADVIKGQKFKPGEVNQFEVFENNVTAAYHKINREDLYPVTIPDERLNRAFVEEGQLQSLIGELISQMSKSNEIDEFVYAKRLIQAYYSNKEKPLLDTQKIKVPDIIAKTRTIEQIKQWLETVKLTLNEMTFPSRKFTSSGIMTQGIPSDIAIILRYQIPTINEINNIASAFNPQYMEVGIPIITVDDFGEGMEKVQGVILDKQQLEIKEVLKDMSVADNARGRYRNYFYHVWQMYAASPFKNAVFLETE